MTTHHHHHQNDNQHCHYDSKESRWNRLSVTSKPCATHQNFDEKNGDGDDDDGNVDADGDDDMAYEIDIPRSIQYTFLKIF